jgi:hypothetical protein
MSFFGQALAGPAKLVLQSAHGPSGRDGSGGLPPSPPAENATTRQDQAGQSCTGDGAGSWKWGIGSDDAREVAGRRIVVVEKCGVAAVADVRSVHIERRVDLEAAVRPAGADALHLVLRPWCAEKVAGIEQRIKRQGRGAIRIGGVFVDDAKYGHIESYPCIDDHGIRLEHIQGNEIAVNGRARCNRAGIGDEIVSQRDALLLSKDDLVLYALWRGSRR